MENAAPNWVPGRHFDHVWIQFFESCDVKRTDTAAALTAISRFQGQPRTPKRRSLESSHRQ